MSIPHNTASSDQAQQIATEFGEDGYTIADLAARHLLPVEQVEQEIRDTVRGWIIDARELAAKIQSLENDVRDREEEAREARAALDVVKRDLSSLRDAFSPFEAALAKSIAHAPEASKTKKK